MRIERRIDLKSVDSPESPDVSPDGKDVVFSAMRGGTADIFIVNIDNGQVRNLTNDAFGDYGPPCAPAGKSVVYLARVSGNDKLFRLELGSGKRTQLTFGTHDDGQGQSLDA